MSLAEIAARIAAHPVEGSPAQMRRAFDALAGQGPDGIRESRRGIDAVAHGTGPDVVWLHGGGYVFGSPASHAAGAAYLAKAAGCRIWLPDYALAPERVWPAPLEDALAFVDSFDGLVALVGDSAGGHLALNVARRRPGCINALALISPNTDRTGASTTRQRNSKRDAMNDDAADRALARMAMPDLAVDDPDASPVLADLTGLPRVWLTASTDEVLLDDSLLLARALGLAGVPLTLRIEAGLPHLWTLWPDLLAEARRTLDRIAVFLND